MGCFDVVLLRCPTCGEEYPAQSKGAGDWDMDDTYYLSEAPDDVLTDVNRHAPFVCTCKTVFQVDVAKRLVVKLDITPEEAERRQVDYLMPAVNALLREKLN